MLTGVAALFDGLVTVDIEPYGYRPRSWLLRCCIHEVPIFYIAHAPISWDDFMLLEKYIAQIYLDLHSTIFKSDSLTDVSNGQNGRKSRSSEAGIDGYPV